MANKYVKDGDHLLLVDGGMSASTIVHCARVGDLAIIVGRTGAAGFEHVQLVFPTKNKANLFWAALETAMTA